MTVAESGEPLKGVTFTFEAENNGMLKSASGAPMPTIVKKSAEKGNFRIPTMTEGSYKVTIKKVGFKDQVVTIYVTKGETTNLKIEMEKN
ncbi:MAG: carboxypeptidase-like regulatory domain-containing protein [Breznakibacter sp.]